VNGTGWVGYGYGMGMGYGTFSKVGNLGIKFCIGSSAKVVRLFCRAMLARARACAFC